MSKVSDIFDALEVVVEAALPGYSELPNAYVPEQNPKIFMNKGYAIGIGEGANTERLLSNKQSIDRSFEIVFVNQLNATETNNALIKTQSKQIFEDAFLVLSAIEKDNDLGQLCVKAKYDSDSGLGFMDEEKQRYFILTMVVSVEYFETL